MNAATTRSDVSSALQGGADMAMYGRQPGSSPPGLLDVEGVAAMLGVGVRLIRRFVDQRRIPFVKVGHYVRFDPREIATWINERRVPERGDRRWLPR